MCVMSYVLGTINVLFGGYGLAVAMLLERFTFEGSMLDCVSLRFLNVGELVLEDINLMCRSVLWLKLWFLVWEAS